jgi:hypothetical protein
MVREEEYRRNFNCVVIEYCGIDYVLGGIDKMIPRTVHSPAVFLHPSN